MLKLSTFENQTNFEPGDTIDIIAEWQLESLVAMIEVRLIWYTRGKGDPEIRVVESQQVDKPQQSEVRGFTFTLPTSPYSFSGKLISLTWAIELIVTEEQTTRFDIVMAPGGKEITLEAVDSSTKHWLQFGS